MGVAKKIGRHRRVTRSNPPSHQLTTTLAQAKMWMEQDSPELALPLLQEVLTQHPTHLETLRLLGSVYLDLGDPDMALQHFLSYLTLDPSHPEVLLYLGQLHHGEDSAKYFLKAIDVLERLPSPCASELAQWSNAYCALAELYLTDLCFDPVAPAHCESCLQKAMSIDPSNPDPYVTLSSLYVSLEKDEDAWAVLKRGLDQWFPAWQQYWASLTDAPLSPPGCPLPSLQIRKLSAKLCMELLQELPLALDLLHSCLREFDQDVEVWYLFGWGSLLLSEQEDTPGLLEDAMTCLMKAKKYYEQQQYDDPALLKHIDELVLQLQAKNIQPHPEEEEDDGTAWLQDNGDDDGEDDEEWEDELMET